MEKYMFNRMLEDYLNQTKKVELAKMCSEWNAKSYQLEIRLDHYDELDDCILVYCHILWMGTIIRFNQRFVIDSKEIRKIKLLSLE